MCPQVGKCRTVPDRRVRRRAALATNFSSTAVVRWRERQDQGMFFFSLSSWQLALLILAVVGAATLAGHMAGKSLRTHSGTLREPFGVLQGALLGVVGLVLAFGLTLAVGRYQDRRAATVAEANAIGTTYLRAQLIAEPARSLSLDALRRYTTLAVSVANEVPNSSGFVSGGCGASPDMRSPARRSRVPHACTWTASTRRSISSPCASRP
jgi:hypothetical protein